MAWVCIYNFAPWPNASASCIGDKQRTPTTRLICLDTIFFLSEWTKKNTNTVLAQPRPLIGSPTPSLPTQGWQVSLHSYNSSTSPEHFHSTPEPEGGWRRSHPKTKGAGEVSPRLSPQLSGQDCRKDGTKPASMETGTSALTP